MVKKTLEGKAIRLGLVAALTLITATGVSASASPDPSESVLTCGSSDNTLAADNTSSDECLFVGCNDFF